MDLTGLKPRHWQGQARDSFWRICFLAFSAAYSPFVHLQRQQRKAEGLSLLTPPALWFSASVITAPFPTHTDLPASLLRLEECL